MQLATVKFYGDEILAMRDDIGRPVVPMRPICKNLGLSWGSQYNRINRDDFLSTCVVKMKAQIDGQSRVIVCLLFEALALWLVTVSSGSVKEELRPQLKLYKAEVATVLARHFHLVPPDEPTQLQRRLTIGDDLARVAAILAVVREARMTIGRTVAIQIWRQHLELPTSPAFEQMMRVMGNVGPLFDLPAEEEDIHG
jgi:hypothetical protein